MVLETLKKRVCGWQKLAALFVISPSANSFFIPANKNGGCIYAGTGYAARQFVFP
jgi:hypothetical protein